MVLNILLQLITILTESTFWSYHPNPCSRNLFCNIQLANLFTEVTCFRASCVTVQDSDLQGTSKGKGGSLECGHFAASFLWKVSGGTDVRKLLSSA